MSWFHRHQWRARAATYGAPIEDVPYTRDDRLGQEYRMGCTCILLTCETCSDVKTVRLVGKPIDKGLADLVLGPE